MLIQNTAVLSKAARKNAPLRAALNDWVIKTQAARWRNIQDVRATFRSADGVSVKLKGGTTIVVTVFNIKGNEYRLLTAVNYAMSSVTVIDLITHHEYNKDFWQRRL